MMLFLLFRTNMLMMDMILDISNQLDMNILSSKIISNIATLTGADR